MQKCHRVTRLCHLLLQLGWVGYFYKLLKVLVGGQVKLQLEQSFVLVVTYHLLFPLHAINHPECEANMLRKEF
jgi:hypothetical protein